MSDRFREDFVVEALGQSQRGRAGYGQDGCTGERERRSASHYAGQADADKEKRLKKSELRCTAHAASFDFSFRQLDLVQARLEGCVSSNSIKE